MDGHNGRVIVVDKDKEDVKDKVYINDDKDEEEEVKTSVDDDILAGESVLNVDTHEGADEVLGLLADVVPVGGVKLKLPCRKRSQKII